MTPPSLGLAATRAVSRMRATHVAALRDLTTSGIPFLVGGALALGRYTGIERAIKDLDIFVLPHDAHRVLDFFGSLGRRVEFTFPHWLGKVYFGRAFMDVIFNSGNGVARVDEGWFAHARASNVLGVPVRLCPPEEMIWSKAFVQERERFDGADVMHLIAHVGRSLDWRRLHERFGPHWRILLGHLVTFGFVYPDRRGIVPAWVMDDLVLRLSSEHAEPDTRVCNGTLLSREQYLSDLRREGYQDARLAPVAYMTPEALEIWNRDIHGQKAR